MRGTSAFPSLTFGADRRNGELTERSRVYKLDQSLATKFVKGLDSTDKLQGNGCYS